MALRLLGGGEDFPAGELIGDGTVGTPGLRFIADPDTGIYRPAANAVGISTGGVDTGKFETDLVTLKSTNAGALGMVLRLYQLSASPAASDVAGRLSFMGRDATPADVELARIDGRISDTGAGAADSGIDLWVRKTGKLGRIAIFSPPIAPATEGAEALCRIQTLGPAGASGAFELWAVSDFGAGQPVLRILDGAGGTELARVDGDGALTALLSLKVAGTKVVGAQGASIADASGGAVIDAEARAAVNAVISRLEAHGLIATV